MVNKGSPKRRDMKTTTKKDGKKAYYGKYDKERRVQAAVKQCCKVDKHYVDLGPTSYACDTTGSITLLATVPQGTTQVTRNGKKIIWDSIQTRGSFSTGTTSTANSLAAWMLVYDRRPTGVLPAITDILVTANSNSFVNDDNANRFKILRRDMRYLNSNNAGTAFQDRAIEDFIVVNKRAEFKSLGTGAIADIEEGALYLVTVGNIAAGTTAPGIAATFRVRFHDD